MVPCVAACETHQRPSEISSVTQKRLSAQQRPFQRRRFREQPIADDPSMLRRFFPGRRSTPTLDAGCYDGTRVSFFSTVRALTHGGRNHARSVRARDQDPEPIGVGSKAPNELTLPISSKPDQCLIALVTILARQAVRDFIQAGWDGQEKCGLPNQGGF